MEKINAPKKERKFLKAVGKVAGILLQEFVLGLGRKFIGKKIDRIGNKRQALLIFLFLFCNIAFASIDSIPYPITGNKQRLGWQTSGNGLVYRGSASDTITKPSNYANKDIKAYLLLDTVNNVLYNYIASKGGWQFSNTDSIVINNNFIQPVDSLFFDTSVPPNNIDTAKMRWDSDLGTVVLGMYDQVPNELGFKSFWLVKNQTGTTITKGSIVYANGTVGASGRITVAKFIANGSIDAKYLLGITAHDLSDGEDGYVISFGKIRQVNTDTFAAGAILYPSPTVAGVWTDVEPVAPNIDMPIGFCINSSSNNGTIAIRVNSGAKVHELQDVDTTGLNSGEGLVYNGSYFVASTGKLLTPSDTASLSNRINAKVNISDTASMLTNYLRTGTAASTYLPLTGGTTTGLITSTFTNTSNYSTSATDNNAFTIYNNTQSTNNIYGGLQFLIGENSGAIPGGPGLAQIYAIRAGGASNPSTDLTFSTKSSSSGVLEKMRIKFDGKVGIGTSTPSYLLDVNGTFNATGNSLIGGTLGVTGATTLSNTLAVTGFSTFSTGAVINENSNDSDTRIESDGNANMVFIDASTDRVGIGTSSPSKTLDVNGTLNASGEITGNSFKKAGGSFYEFLKADGTVDNNDYLTTSSAGSTYYPKSGGTISGAVTISSTLAVTGAITEGGNNVMTNLDTVALSNRIDAKVSLTGDEYINGTKTFGGLIIPSNGMILTATGNNSTKLIGINTSSYVGEVTLGTGLSLTSNVLNVAIPTERYYFNLGIVAGAADNSASTYDYSYPANIFIVPTSLNGYCIDSVYIRAIGCSTCPPVSPDLDYYVGVYKANAGARVTTSGASLQGSQITMNEYDLNEVNVNYSLSTGESWWVYLNGTYTSDMAYITAGFIVKKTCN